MRKIILTLLLAFTAGAGFCQDIGTPDDSAFVKQIQDFERLVAEGKYRDATVLLRKMEEDTQGLEKQQKIVLLKQIAPAWQIIGNDEEAKRVFQTLAELEPDSVGTLIHLFDLARKMRDEPEMTERMKRVRELAGEGSPEDIYCRAAREVYRFLANNATKEELEDARKLLEETKAKRPNWPNIPRALAEIALLQRDYGKAIEHLYEIDKLGALTTQQLELLIKLLYNEKREDEIPALVEKHSKRGLIEPGFQLEEPRIGHRWSSIDDFDFEAELEAAKTAGDCLRIGNLALRVKKYDEALAAFEAAVDMDPENHTGWLARLQTMKLMGKDADELLAVKAEMEKAVPPDKLLRMGGKMQQALGDAATAEKAFLEAVEAYPDDLEVRYCISSFYLRTTRPELARPHLEKMLPLIDESDGDERIKAQQREWVEKSLEVLDERESQEQQPGT